MTQRPGNQEAWRQHVRAFRSVAESLRSPVPRLLAALLAPEKLLDMAGELPLVGFSPFGTLPRELGDEEEQRQRQGSARPAGAAPGLSSSPRRTDSLPPAAGLTGTASQPRAPTAIQGGPPRPVFSLKRISGPDGRAARSGPVAPWPAEQARLAGPGGPPQPPPGIEVKAQSTGHQGTGQAPRQVWENPRPGEPPSGQRPDPLTGAQGTAALTAHAGGLLAVLAEEALRGTRTEGRSAGGPPRGQEWNVPQGPGQPSSAPWQEGPAEAVRGSRWPGGAGLSEGVEDMLGRLAGELLAPSGVGSRPRREMERLQTGGGEGRDKGNESGSVEADPVRQGLAMEALPWTPRQGGGPAPAASEAPRAPLPDAEMLAALVNQVLLEQARLHGVDLS